MGKPLTFDQFREEFLISAANWQNGKSPTPIGAYTISYREFPLVPEAWIPQVVELLIKQGLGSCRNTGDDQEFYISGEGLLKATRIKSSRTIFGRMKMFTFDNWMSILALIFSAFALSKS